MTRNYSSELDRNVREILFARFVARANKIQTRKKPTAMLTELTEQISKLTEVVDLLAKELEGVLQQVPSQPITDGSAIVAEPRSEVVDAIADQVARIASVFETVRNLRNRLDIPC